MPEKDDQLSIRVAGNTLIPCLQSIAEKGYEVSHYFLNDEPDRWENSQWDAEKEGRRFSATSPVELLGLIAMWETRGDDWEICDGEGALYDELVENAPMYDSDGNEIDR